MKLFKNAKGIKLKKSVTLKEGAFARNLFQIFFLAGAFVLLILVAITGKLSNSSPLIDLYWIRADDLSGTGAKVYWTFWGTLYNYGYGYYPLDIYAGCPFSPYDNYSKKVLGSSYVIMPTDFIDRRNIYFYLGRFVFPLILLSLIFIGFSLVFSIFVRLFPPSFMKFTSILITISLLFAACAVAFQTAIIGIGNTAFQQANVGSNVGSYLVGIAWTAVAVLFILFFITWWDTFQSTKKKRLAKAKAKGGKKEEKKDGGKKEEKKDGKKEEGKKEEKKEEKKDGGKKDEGKKEEKK